MDILCIVLFFSLAIAGIMWAEKRSTEKWRVQHEKNMAKLDKTVKKRNKREKPLMLKTSIVLLDGSVVPYTKKSFVWKRVHHSLYSPQSQVDDAKSFYAKRARENGLEVGGKHYMPTTIKCLQFDSV